MSDVLFHRDFPASYECSPLNELPGTPQDIQYFNPSHTPQSQHDGLLACIEPENGKTWTGVFEWGDLSSDSGMTGFWSLPREDSVCVVSRGVAYIVPVANAEAYEVVKLRPVCHVVPVPSLGMIVFGDFTKVIAFGREGKLWTTHRLSWDGLELSGVEDERLIGTGWDAPGQKRVSFSVDLKTGDHEGGSAPPV